MLPTLRSRTTGVDRPVDLATTEPNQSQPRGAPHAPTPTFPMNKGSSHQADRPSSMAAILGTSWGRVRTWAARTAVTVGTIAIMGASLVAPAWAAGPHDFPAIEHATGVIAESSGTWHYHVAAGDTAFSIARRFKVPLDALDQTTALDLAGGALAVGDRIPLPAGLIDAPTPSSSQPVAVAKTNVVAVPVASLPTNAPVPTAAARVDVGGEIFLVGGAALIGVLGAVYFAASRRDDGGYTIGRRISKREAVRRLRNGEDTYTPYGQDAKELARNASANGRTTRDGAHQDGYLPHYHDEDRSNHSHSMFGRPRPRNRR